MLHDVGKIAIPKEIINKPGKLDPHEWNTGSQFDPAVAEALLSVVTASEGPAAAPAAVRHKPATATALAA